jgi:D-apionate oxidoisomerase
MGMKIALMGAGGKMGCRIADNLKGRSAYEVAYVEPGEAGRANLARRGLSPTSEERAVAGADAVILAVPDRLIGPITKTLVPRMMSRAMLIGLDPAAAYAGVMALRDDLSYFVTHPCHPPLFNEDTAPERRNDWFGGVHASQHIVCALHSGPDEDYVKGERIAIDIYGNEVAPVIASHRVTVEQMAMLEPALVETFAATLIQSIKEMKDEAVRRGVPEDAATAFMMGHLRTILAIVFGYAGFPFSDGALLAMERARARIFHRDWMARVMDPESIRHSVAEITDSLAG